MLTPYDHALAVTLVLLFPLWAVTFGFRRLRRAEPECVGRVRLSLYRSAMAIQWSLVVLTAAPWLLRGRGAGTLGLVPLLNGGTIGTALGFAIIAGYIIRQRRHVLTDDEGLEEVRRRLDHIERLIPRTTRELRAFFGLSVTAGICEEVLYRGFLFWYLQHWFGLVPTIGMAALVFGLAHSYQGPRGVLLTGAVGAFLGAVYALTGSLYLPMLMHGLMDVHSGHLGFVAFRRAAALAAERRAAFQPEPPLTEEVATGTGFAEPAAFAHAADAGGAPGLAPAPAEPEAAPAGADGAAPGRNGDAGA